MTMNTKGWMLVYEVTTAWNSSHAEDAYIDIHDMSRKFDKSEFPQEYFENLYERMKADGYSLDELEHCEDVPDVLSDSLRFFVRGNTNVRLHEGYYYAIASGDKLSWSCDVKQDKGETFTVEKAREFLAEMEKLYMATFPDRENPNFYRIEYDITNYKPYITYTGDETSIPVGPKKKGVYNARTGVLRLWRNGICYYEDDNGSVCTDPSAIMDSMPVHNGGKVC